MENEERRKRSREGELEEEESGEVCSLPEAKRVRTDILGILEDDDYDAGEGSSDSGAEEELVNSVMRSLQEEIEGEECSAGGVNDVSVQPDLGYLLEASDDELGLPPASSDDEFGLIPAYSDGGTSENDDIFSGEAPREVLGFGGSWDFEEGMMGFGLPAEFGGAEERYEEDETVLFESLFDYSDAGLWRPESLPAV
ncbi:uncharacterized protein LOC116257141 [Nymphaea colorata]|uniref:Uncharacterized protein n=1 Tax=Nymphaea colorata TaxID=210225 RepID=A0A5K1F1L4_9MAGN|nr:uncharacterized protein LOC116257141 [Nymphaea colorata]VVW57912.1 unnamed protein product [Nymphaea colorata]